MFNNIDQKIRQIVADPVLRKWIWARLLMVEQGEPLFQPHRPPYLLLPDEGVPQPKSLPTGERLEEKPAGLPSHSLTIQLPGLDLTLSPGEEGELFETIFDDIETFLGLHRFAWIPVYGPSLGADWVRAIWQAWCERHGTNPNGWAWHPYTAAERIINLLWFFDRHGVPGNKKKTLEILQDHGPAIINRLEYFGDHHTSNHLANNGRGLFYLGIFLGIETYADLGGTILLQEANRIFRPSGILREGSSHYHCLVTKNYIEAWLLADRFNRPESAALKQISAKALAAADQLYLNDRLPLIGDISPDCPPQFLYSMNGKSNDGWLANLGPADRNKLHELVEAAKKVEEISIDKDGWHKFRFFGWSGFIHVAPEGWCQMPGHGHQDCGAVELHFEDMPLIIDPGRGRYGETGYPVWERSAYNQSTLIIDGQDPYPANKPYYSRMFRKKICGEAPSFFTGNNYVELSYDGYRRFSSLGTVTTTWQFDESKLTLRDSISGKSRHKIERYFYTPFSLRRQSGIIYLKSGDRKFAVHSKDGDLDIAQGMSWQAYGKGKPVSVLKFTSVTKVPRVNVLEVERIS